MNIDLTKQEFICLKKWLKIEVLSAESYIQKELNNPKKKETIIHLQSRLNQLRPIYEKINEECEIAHISIQDNENKR